MNPFCDPSQWLFAIITGVVASLVVLLVQFGGSAANRCTRKIVSATKEIRSNWQEGLSGNPRLDAVTGMEALLRNKHRFHLSVFIERFLKAFGTDDIPPIRVDGKQIFPCLIWIEKNDKGQDVDRWRSYQLYVAHLANNVSEHRFLRYFGVHFLSKSYRQSLLLTTLLERIEQVVGAHDGIMDNKRARPHIDNYPDSKGHPGEYFWISAEGYQLLEIQKLVEEFEQLRTAWRAWEGQAK